MSLFKLIIAGLSGPTAMIDLYLNIQTVDQIRSRFWTLE